MSQDLNWFAEFNKTAEFEFLKRRPIAYFCAEFALSDTIAIFAGGLGVLAGDTVREAADRNIPFVALGLYYYEGYVCQEINEKGEIIERDVYSKPQDVGLVPVEDGNKNRIIVELSIADRKVLVQAWKWQKGSVPVYLLDTNVVENNPSDQKITNRLYDIDKETRLKQEMILGIGGVRLLEKLGIHPSVYHMNEGHSAMLVLDLIRHEMEEQKIGFADAKNRMSQHIVFTNHTLVSAGEELFSNDLASALLASYANEIAVPIKDIIELGLVQESSIFSMTMLSLRLASKVNAVSQLHQRKAKEIWTDHPMGLVTNGIHIPTWDCLHSRDTVWEDHLENKRKLLLEIKKISGVAFGEHELLLGWARRMVEYKRPLALFEDLTRFKSIATKTDRPVRVVIAGKAPPGDTKGEELIRRLQQIIKEELPNIVVSLPYYDTEMAKLLMSGCDVWLNTPVVGFEACGTSGMKAALNGALPATTKDGWIDEVELFGIGWVLDSDAIHKNVLDILESQIIPMYYAKDEQGIPKQWLMNMLNGRELIQNQFSTTRMLRNYIETMYVKVLEVVRQEQQDDSASLGR